VSLFICPLISLSVAAVSLDIWTLLSDFSSAGQCCLHYSVQSSGFTIVKLAMSILAGFIFVFLALPCQTLLSGALILTVGRNIGHCGCNFLMVNAGLLSPLEGFCLEFFWLVLPFSNGLITLGLTSSIVTLISILHLAETVVPSICHVAIELLYQAFYPSIYLPMWFCLFLLAGLLNLAGIITYSFTATGHIALT